MKRDLMRFPELLLLTGGVAAAIALGSSVHRRMLEAAELYRYRAAVRELTQTMRAMRPRAMAQQRTLQLRIDRTHQAFALTALQGDPARPLQVVERAIWLPRGLEITEAPESITVSPSGPWPTTSILITAPAHHRLFRVTSLGPGHVHYDEEPTL
jgi:1,6-anhydro-N-acetylmuramate kinase